MLVKGSFILSCQDAEYIFLKNTISFILNVLKTKNGGQNMVYYFETDLLDCDVEKDFVTQKDRSRGDRRKIDYKNAKKKKTKINHHGFDYYDNFHQYSKNKVHCSCRICRGKDYFGRHILTEQEIKSNDKMQEELKEINENLLAETRKEIA